MPVVPEILMPQLGETVTEGTITRWIKSVGDHVDRDEPLFEVSTDKVDSEVPSALAGTLSKILVQEGETVAVGTPLALIGESQELSSTGPSPALSQPDAPAPVQTSVPPTQAPKVASTSSQGGANRETLILSPVVRRIISENNLDVSRIVGTGPGGRITRQDVLSLIDANRAIGVQRSPEIVSTGAIGDEIIPFSNIRRRTAEHMVRSKQTSAHTLVVTEVDYELIESIRRHSGEQFRLEEGFGLNYLPFIIITTVEALRTWPQLNSSVGEDALIVHHEINIGVAVDLQSEGLIVPVIHQADGKRLRALAREVRLLADRARTKKLSADDVAGGTFTISNPGPFGTLLTAPIINQPQVAILSTDSVQRKPVVLTGQDGSESIGIHSVGNLALSFDHRVIDGAIAAQFLNTMKSIIETRDWKQEL